MAITKTGVTITDPGGHQQMFERNGQQSWVSVSNLQANTTYTAEAYVREDNGRTTTSAAVERFTTLQAGVISLTNASSYDTGADTAFIRVFFTSTYPVDTVRVLNDDTKDFIEETTVTYSPVVSGTTSGSFTVTVLGPMQWFKILFYDMYGEEPEEEAGVTIFELKDITQ